MKKLILLSLLLSSQAFGQGRALDAEIQLTARLVQQAENQLREKQQRTVYTHKDYKDIVYPEYSNGLSLALQAFEAKMRADIYAPLKEYQTQYNNIVNAPADTYSLDQRQMIVDNIRIELNQLRPELEYKYHQALRSLYLAAARNIYYATNDFSGPFEVYKSRSSSCFSFNITSTNGLRTNSQKNYAKYVEGSRRKYDNAIKVAQSQCPKKVSATYTNFENAVDAWSFGERDRSPQRYRGQVADSSFSGLNSSNTQILVNKCTSKTCGLLLAGDIQQNLKMIREQIAHHIELRFEPRNPPYLGREDLFISYSIHDISNPRGFDKNYNGEYYGVFVSSLDEEGTIQIPMKRYAEYFGSNFSELQALKLYRNLTASVENLIQTWAKSTDLGFAD